MRVPFLRLRRCPDCGEEHLLAFTCKGRHFCFACHQRRVRQISAWIATSACHEVPHRKFVFTIPRVPRGIFRKRRDLLGILFQTATDTLRDSFRTRLDLPDGRIGAIAAVHTFGDFLFFQEVFDSASIFLGAGGKICSFAFEQFTPCHPSPHQRTRKSRL